MKIVHVIDYYQPKLGYQETFLAKEQAKMGYDVYIVTSDRYNPILYSGDAVQKILGDRRIKPGFFIEDGISVWRLKCLIEFPRAIWMSNLEKKILELNPDILIVHGIVNFASIRIALLKGKRTHFKLICDDHMTFGASRHLFRHLYPFFRLFFAQLLLNKTDALVGVANTSKVFMHKKYGFPLDKIHMIPLGADTNIFKFDNRSREKLRKSFEISESDIVFIYAGKITAVKGPHILIEAAVELYKAQTNFKILLVGNGPLDYIQKIQDFLKLHNLNSLCIFHDAVKNTELYQYYSVADVAVWPKEASLSMMEAMACGLPVIMSEDSEVQERLNYENGLLYIGNDPVDLAKKMELLFDPNIRKSMGENGRKIVKEKLNWEVIAKQFIELAN